MSLFFPPSAPFSDALIHQVRSGTWYVISLAVNSSGTVNTTPLLTLDPLGIQGFFLFQDNPAFPDRYHGINSCATASRPVAVSSSPASFAPADWFSTIGSFPAFNADLPIYASSGYNAVNAGPCRLFARRAMPICGPFEIVQDTQSGDRIYLWQGPFYNNFANNVPVGGVSPGFYCYDSTGAYTRQDNDWAYYLYWGDAGGNFVTRYIGYHLYDYKPGFWAAGAGTPAPTLPQICPTTNDPLSTGYHSADPYTLGMSALVANDPDNDWNITVGDGIGYPGVLAFNCTICHAPLLCHASAPDAATDATQNVTINGQAICSLPADQNLFGNNVLLTYYNPANARFGANTAGHPANVQYTQVKAAYRQQQLWNDDYTSYPYGLSQLHASGGIVSYVSGSFDVSAIIPPPISPVVNHNGVRVLAETNDYAYPGQAYFVYQKLTPGSGGGGLPPDNNAGANPASARKRDWKNHVKLALSGHTITAQTMDIASPLYGWRAGRTPVAVDAHKEFHLTYDARGILYCLYDSESDPVTHTIIVKQARSDDDGSTWGGNAPVFQTQPYTMQPRLAELEDGGILRCAFVPDPDPDHAGQYLHKGRILAVFQHSGERLDDPANPLTEFFLRDDSGQDYASSVDLKFQDTGYDVIAPSEEPNRFYLCASVAGGSGNTDFWSGDFGQTWKKIVTQTTPPG